MALAFPELLMAGQPHVRALIAAVRHRLRALLGTSQNRTVVAVTRWHGESEPAQPGQIARDVATLNDFLMAYSLVSDDPLLGPLTLAELPSIAPMVAVTGTEEGPVSLQGFASVSPWRQALLQIPRDEEDLIRAAIMFDAELSGKDPTFRVIALLHEALRDMTGGRFVRSVMLAGTAIELLVHSTIERAWASMGLDPARLPGALQAPLRSQLERQLAKVLGAKIDLNAHGTAVADWWHGGYSLRNDVIHNGGRPSQEQVSAGLRTAFELAAFVGRELEGNKATSHLRGMLPIHQVPSRRYGFLRRES